MSVYQLALAIKGRLVCPKCGDPMPHFYRKMGDFQRSYYVKSGIILSGNDTPGRVVGKSSFWCGLSGCLADFDDPNLLKLVKEIDAEREKHDLEDMIEKILAAAIKDTYKDIAVFLDTEGLGMPYKLIILMLETMPKELKEKLLEHVREQKTLEEDFWWLIMGFKAHNMLPDLEDVCSNSR